MFRKILLPIFLFVFVVDANAHRANYADLVEKLMPSVVNIRTSQEVEVGRQFNFPEGSPFREFFKNLPSPAPQQKRQASSLGSGFITDESGIVITNYHVVQQADEIFVGLQSGTSYSAELVGYDTRTDLAVLRITEADEKFKAVKFGDSDKARVGDAVLAIGNPLGLGGTVTSGIISARGRDINSGPYDDFIQTDASINKGNSGGPLFNDKGEVIGINTAIYSQSGGSIGIGFAIPSVQAVNVIEQLLEFGTTKRGWLGVNIQPVSDEISATLGLKKVSGALVSRVYMDSPAGKGGIKVGDVILKFDGKEVENSRRLPFMVAQTAVDKKVKVEVWRNGRSQSLTVRLGELEKFEISQGANRQGSNNVPENSDGGVVEFAELGISVAPYSSQLQELYGLESSDATGLIVVAVNPNSEAQRIGLAKGVQLLQAGRDSLNSTQDLRKAIDSVKASGLEHILLLARVGNDSRFVTLKITQ